MAQNLIDQPWQTYLPEVYTWLDRVSTNSVSEPQSGAVHVVAASAGDQKSKSIEVDSPSIAKDLADKLKKTAELHNWQAKSAALQVSVDDRAYLLVPVSKTKTSSVQLARQFGMDAARALKDCRPNQVVFCDVKNLDTLSIFDGYASGSYNIGLFKNVKKKSQTNSLPEAVSFLGSAPADDALRKTKAMAKACAFTRMLQDAPPNWLTPTRFSEIAKDIAKENGVDCKVGGRKELTDLGMGAFLSVAQGSPMDPRMITIEIDGQKSDKTIALVGKGLTFDSGGTSLKPAAGMGEMKYDMSGGAAVLGAAHYLSQVKPKTKVICLIGAVENISGGHATRPSDIVVAMNGKTVDIQNTDAEGRLVLCDLIHYAADTVKADTIVDVATLTGAVLHALGHAGAAVMSNDQATADAILEASRKVGEPFWQLPLWPELDKEVKGDVADLNNIAKPNVRAGSIIGGVYLKEFVGDTNWAHLDIAGTGWSCKATGFPGSGGSAYSVRTMVELCS